MDKLGVIVPLKYVMLMNKIIHVVSKRGGFIPDEYKAVGELFDYLNNEIKLIEEKLNTDNIEPANEPSNEPSNELSNELSNEPSNEPST